MTDSKNQPLGQGEGPVFDNDPLMELARLSGMENDLFNNNMSRSNETASEHSYASDLERELASELGFDFSASDEEATPASEPVDFTDFLTDEPSFLRQPQQAAPQQTAESAPEISLEQQLENLLFQDSAPISAETQTFEELLEIEPVSSQPAPAQYDEPAPAAEADVSSFYEEISIEQNLQSEENNIDEFADFDLDFNFDAAATETEALQVPADNNSETMQNFELDELQLSEEDYSADLSDALLNELTLDMGETESPESVDYAEQPTEQSVRKEFVPSRFETLTDDNYTPPVFKNPTATSFPFFKPTALTAKEEEKNTQQDQEGTDSNQHLTGDFTLSDTAQDEADPLDFRLNELSFADEDFSPSPSAGLDDYGASAFENFDSQSENSEKIDMASYIERELATQTAFEWQESQTQDIPASNGQPIGDGSDIEFNEGSFDFSFEEEKSAISPPSHFTSDQSEEHTAYSDDESENKTEYQDNIADAPDFLNQYATYSVPEIETVSIGEEIVEQTHNLSLPEVVYEEEKDLSSLSELESEFSEVFNAIEAEQQPKEPAPQAPDQSFDDIFNDSFSQYAVAGSAAGAAYAAGQSAANTQAQNLNISKGENPASKENFFNDWAEDETNKAIPQNVLETIKRQQAADAAYPSAQDLGAATAAYRDHPVRGRRAMLAATVAGVVVLIGGIAYHFISGDSTPDEPVVIAADNQPIKVQPDNPGGETVPNQDKAVYDRVEGTIPQVPQQQALVSDQEEPVNLPIDNDDAPDNHLALNDVISGANEENVAEPDANPPLIAPRQVQTIAVRPDGSIVSTTLPIEAPRQAETVATAPAQTTNPVASDASPIIAPPAEQAPTIAQPPIPSQQQAPAPVTPPPAPAVTQPATPAAPSTAQTTPIAAGTYMIQVASQPSEALAEKSLASVKQKYGSILGNRATEIRKADIPGKGTYYRVRVAGGSKIEANALCERLKTAGGSCFVTL